MPVPKVVIVGRPNVGKSSLLNWLAGKRIAIVDPTAGVTRDRVTWLMHADDRYFELVDTGGMGIEDADNLTADIERQIEVGIDEADLILFVTDGRVGRAALDEMVAERLRKVDKPKLLVVNKCDSPRLDAEIHEFRKLHEGNIVVTSVKGNRNRNELLTAILDSLPTAQDHEQEEGSRLESEPELKLAIVGRRNVGKSTFINALAQAERVIVSEVPGTTRDSIDVRFEIDGKTIVAIDTPGVRKRKSLANDIEFYGLTRARRSIRRADVVLMFFDSQETISRVDKQLLQDIGDQHKPCVFVVNKWDLAEDMTTEAWMNYLFGAFSMLRHCPVAFLTASENRNVKKVVNLAQSIFKQSRTRVPTAGINNVIRAAIRHTAPPYRRNKRPKIFYATQVAVEPPTIVLKCNDPSLFDEPWKRYLLGVLREELPFHEVPIRLIFRRRGRDDAEVAALDDVEQANP